MRREQSAPLLNGAHHVDPCFAYHFQKPGDNDDDRMAALTCGRAQGEHPSAPAPETCSLRGRKNGGRRHCRGGACGGRIISSAIRAHLRPLRGRAAHLDDVCALIGPQPAPARLQQENSRPTHCYATKGLAASIKPIGAVLASRKYLMAFADGLGLLQHGHTYLGQPIDLARLAPTHAVQDVTCAPRKPVWSRMCRRWGRAASPQRLSRRFHNHPHLGTSAEGARGLFHGGSAGGRIAQTKTRSIRPTQAQRAHQAAKAMARGGLMSIPWVAHYHGVRGDHVMLAPPSSSNSSHWSTLVQAAGRRHHRRCPRRHRGHH